MININCHCGNIRLEFKQLPSTVRDCDCAICNRLGALWADFKHNEITIETTEPTGTYLWGDEDYEMHHCRTCGCTTHYTAAVEQDTSDVGVNLRMLEREQLEQIPIKTKS
ncbi:MAG: GFA family protein [Calditrichia bacterium]